MQQISNPLNKVLELKGVTYEFKNDEFADKTFPPGRHYGVIAQEIEQIVPEVVTSGQDGSKSVNYTELIPVLVEAIKEQQLQINELRHKLNTLRTK